MALFLAVTSPVVAQTLDAELQGVPVKDLAAMAKLEGDAVRGAVVFFQPHMACSKCHVVGRPQANSLGPDLTTLGKDATDEFLIESVLFPSKVIRKGFEVITVVTTSGKSISALLVEQSKEKVVVKDVTRGGELTTFTATEVEELKQSSTSNMPAGQMNQLHSRQQFLDLVRYLMEIRDGGAVRAMQLQPSAALLTFTVPEYEKRLDHAGLIGDWNAESLRRGEVIYQRVCGNCHGTREKAGSLPTSLKFAEGKFKNGSDPLSMYRTLTHGFGLMAPQAWMVPSQKYDVIHYVRETYIKPHNPTQFVAVDAAYLARLPKGNTRGPEPSKIVPWSAMDYGPSLAHTFEVPGLPHNFAYKGIAVRLDPGAGGVSRGRHWMLFDTDTLRVAAAWNGSGNSDENFIDWRGIQFDGAHGVHPRVVGRTAFANSTGPGWGHPDSGAFRDDQRVIGRDGRRYGPLPREWARFKGVYHHGQRVVLSYSIGTTDVLELPGLMTRESPAAPPVFLRTFNVGPRDRDLLLQVAELSDAEARPTIIRRGDNVVIQFAPPSAAAVSAPRARLEFDGKSFLEVANKDAFDLITKDFTITARIKTKSDGSIWSLCQTGAKWVPDGQSLFVRDGRLCFDIGWVGAVTAKTKVSDGEWHNVSMTWDKAEQRVRLYVDGRLDGEGKLVAKAALPKSVVRVGFTAPNFPRPATFFRGEIAEVRFYQKRITERLGDLDRPVADEAAMVSRWLLSDVTGPQVADAAKRGNDAEVRRAGEPSPVTASPLVAGFSPRTVPGEWVAEEGRLRLRIAKGPNPLRFTVWLPSSMENAPGTEPGQVSGGLLDQVISDADRDLSPLTRGGPPRWTQKLETQAILGTGEGPFASDVLTPPETNPWLALTRFSGLDFFSDGRIAVCSWDGDVWIVTPSPSRSSTSLGWQRIASGLYQPLGLRIVGGKIHVTCRDQLAVLHDLNGDGEIDFYQSLNNDHQVTEHFHEFAMGLQTDAAGNFYYAKSGCHGKAAIVPHHGTLLRVTPDGSRTEILANGFRAANGVCLNPDGSFVVTDQEGFWNPKNRINWVTVPSSGKPNFYGNMLGYHDVTDPSDSAMVPPLCWITNAFDRSPAELLWVDSDQWGPLKGSLLNLSYGYGKVFLVPHEKVRGAMQGGMIELPLPTFPTGVMRGRFHPLDGQLYLCGMFAWAGNATHPGGLYRLRATGKQMHLPTELHATKTGLKLKFTERLDPTSLDVGNLKIKTWALKRTASYGSKHFDEKSLVVRKATLEADAKTLQIEIADMRPTWCMEIGYSLRSSTGAPIQGTIHNTIHELAD